MISGIDEEIEELGISAFPTKAFSTGDLQARLEEALASRRAS